MSGQQRTRRVDTTEYLYGGEVDALEDLTSATVQIGLESGDTITWYDAEWGASDPVAVPVAGVTWQRHTPRTTDPLGPGADESIAAGNYQVLVKITDAPEVPVLGTYWLKVED